MYCYCYICRDGFASVELAECGVCGKWSHVCRICAQADAEELQHAKERWLEEHICFRPSLHATTARRYLERGLADLHSARIRLEAAGYPVRARELSERLWPIEELHAAVKGDLDKPEDKHGD
jgi:hypothetical protein